MKKQRPLVSTRGLFLYLKNGAEGRSRTDTGLPPPVFETGASTIPPLRPAGMRRQLRNYITLPLSINLPVGVGRANPSALSAGPYLPVSASFVLTRICPAPYNRLYWSIISPCLNARINPRSAAGPESTGFELALGLQTARRFYAVADSRAGTA